MYRVEVIRDEMASAVRVLGGVGSAKRQNSIVAKLTGLTVTTVERLRWKKIKRVPADIADCIRETLERHNEDELSRVKHELYIQQKKVAALLEIAPELPFDEDR